MLSPAKLDLCGTGGWHTVAPDDGVRCGCITRGDGEGTGEGGVVTPAAGVTSVAVGTDSPADDGAGVAAADGGFRSDVEG